MTDFEAHKSLSAKLVLDTHVLIWYAEGINLSNAQVEEVDNYRKGAGLLVSSISMWEIAMLLNKGKISLSLPLQEWIGKLASMDGLSMVDLTTEILIESCQLPNCNHKAPADRMIIATARCFDAVLITMDQKILEYGRNGSVKILACDSSVLS
jgi:PIN domain nuclease of toxin-antitoxin system